MRSTLVLNFYGLKGMVAGVNKDGSKKGYPFWFLSMRRAAADEAGHSGAMLVMRNQVKRGV